MSELEELRAWCETHVKIGSKQARVTLGLIESLTVAERERDEWQARALSISAFIPDGTLCGDLQKARDVFREKVALFDEMRDALILAEDHFLRCTDAERFEREQFRYVLERANKIAGSK